MPSPSDCLNLIPPVKRTALTGIAGEPGGLRLTFLNVEGFGITASGPVADTISDLMPPALLIFNGFIQRQFKLTFR